MLTHSVWLCFVLAITHSASRHLKLTFGIRQADTTALEDSPSVSNNKPDTAIAVFAHRWTPCVQQKISKLVADVLGVYDVWVFVNEFPMKSNKCSFKDCFGSSSWDTRCLEENCFVDLALSPYRNATVIYYGDGLPNEHNISDAELFDQMCWNVEAQKYQECSTDEARWWCSSKGKQYTKEGCLGKVPLKQVTYCRFWDRGEATIQFSAGGREPHYKNLKRWRRPWPSICWHPRKGVELFQGVSGRAKPMLLAFIKQMSYDYVWHVEHDMVFNGNWRTFFDGATKGHETTDFLTHTIEEEVDPAWPHWKSPFIESMPQKTWTKLTFMIARISKKLGTNAFKRLAAGELGGHHEAALGTLCRNTSGCEFGSFDAKYVGFVTTGHWAAHSVGCWGDPLKRQCGCCSLGKDAPPPSFTGGVDLRTPAPNKLYHPIKACDLGASR
jgi:hypothetical protein